ncbi:GIY-YIG nuclease family protein [Candidatus Uhrbacteria bacterium]|nr:GIY-YIG nuclease family protein [Candidatus Uhrbacteria bacterium]
MLYVGYSNVVHRRFRQHQSGQVVATRDRRPLELIYHEAYLDEQEAKRRETYLKGGNGRASLKAQLPKTLIRLGYVCI